MNSVDTTQSLSSENAGEICVIEADEGMGELLVELLENQFLVRSFGGIGEFEKSFLTKDSPIRPDLILCNAALRDGSGMDALKIVRKTDAILPFIFLVNQPDTKWTEEAFQCGVTDLLEKPFESMLFIDKFRGRIAQAKMSRARNELLNLLQTQSLLTTTHANRLIDLINNASSVSSTMRSSAAKLRKLAYSWPDEDEIRFRHARKSEEKLLRELEACRIEYLALARTLGLF